MNSLFLPLDANMRQQKGSLKDKSQAVYNIILYRSFVKNKVHSFVFLQEGRCQESEIRLSQSEKREAIGCVQYISVVLNVFSCG